MNTSSTFDYFEYEVLLLFHFALHKKNKKKKKHNILARSTHKFKSILRNTIPIYFGIMSAAHGEKKNSHSLQY